MSDLRLMFLRRARILLPLLGVYVVLCAIEIIVRDNTQTKMIVASASMVLLVGVTGVALDDPLRFFALGEDRLLHLSPTPPFSTVMRISGVLIGFLMVFFIVGRCADLIVGGAEGFEWVTGLVFGVIHKLASLVCAFSVMAVIAALVKPLRSRMAMRGVAWIGFFVLAGIPLTILLRWLAAGPGGAWFIGVTDVRTSPIYAGLFPVLVPDGAAQGVTPWVFTLINAGCGVVFLAAFIVISRTRAMNFLAV